MEEAVKKPITEPHICSSHTFLGSMNVELYDFTAKLYSFSFI